MEKLEEACRNREILLEEGLGICELLQALWYLLIPLCYPQEMTARFDCKLDWVCRVSQRAQFSWRVCSGRKMTLVLLVQVENLGHVMLGVSSLDEPPKDRGLCTSDESRMCARPNPDHYM